jgi:formate dehydrogenase maturation protein FdhE
VIRKCYKCNKTKPLYEFHQDLSANKGKAYICGSCKSLANAIWREKNPKKVKENNDRHRYLKSKGQVWTKA